jgi:DNA-directed RNA polymerase specialized sigma24 family protein
VAAPPHSSHPAGPPFDRWVLARAQELSRFAYVLSGSTDEADAVVQDALVAARLRWARLAGDPEVDARVRALVVRAFLRRHRGSSGGTAGTDANGPWPPASGTPGQPDERSARIWQRCARLTPRQRAALVLGCYADLVPAEIAAVIGGRRSTAAADLQTALALVLPAQDQPPAPLEQVRRALQQYADSAPPAYAPAERAAAAAQGRRRRHAVTAVAAAAVLAVSAGWGLWHGGLGPAEPAPQPSAQRQQPSPDIRGWRWESWGGVEVKVPRSWGHADLTQWCADHGTSGPAVDRPELRGTHVPCSLYDDGRPTYTAGLLMRWAASSPRLSRADVAPYATTRIFTLGDVTLTLVDVDPAVGNAILDSAQVIGWRDHHGCAPQQQLGGAGFLADGPTATLRSGRIGPAAAVSVCRYGLRGDWSGTRLISSRMLTGLAARDLVRALRNAPRTPMPARSRHCRAEEGEFAVLELWPDGYGGAPIGGPASLLVRYDGCRGHGLYDGTTVRRLTRGVLRPVLVPPWSGAIAPDLRSLVRPR